MPPKRKTTGDDSSSSRVVDEFSSLLQQQAKVHSEQIQKLLNIQKQTQQQMQPRGRGQVRHEEMTEGVYDRFHRMNPPEFSGSTDPMAALEWVKALEAIFDYIHLSDADRVSCAIFLLVKTARTWWEGMKVTVNVRTLKWDEFKTILFDKYFTRDVKSRKVKEFFELKKGGMTVHEHC